MAGRLRTLHGLQRRQQQCRLGALGARNTTTAGGGDQEWQEQLSADVQFHKFAQYEFFNNGRTENALRSIWNKHHGDIPIYVAHDSADVWAHPELFRLDKLGQPVPLRAFHQTISARRGNCGETHLPVGCIG